MKKLFAYADAYIRRCDWKYLAMLKFCLASIGFLVGMEVTQEKKKSSSYAAMAVLIATYIPLMAKFFRVILHGEHQKD